MVGHSERQRVTVVDDDPYALDILQRAARMWDFDCQSARSAEDAISLMERSPTPVLVTDLRMPGQGGTWLVREVQQRWPDVSIIVVTAGDEDDAMSQCLQAGAHHYFLKPINLDEFYHALQSTFKSYYHRFEKEKVRELLEKELAVKTRKLRRTFFSAINSLVRTLEARDPYTSGHSHRVSELSVKLAQRLTLPPKLIKQIRLSAKLHDIGKVGMAEGILNKPAELTQEEIDIVRDHPVIGERILKPIIRSRNILAGIRNHHERYDGTGYPDRLQGEAIPLVARVITIADCFDALTSCRSYRTTLDFASAVEAMLGDAGKQFDPVFVRVFAEMILS